MKFKDLKLSENILKGIEEAGFVECTPVQAETFIHSFHGKDVCVQSQTGTGKTAAYLITIFKLFSDESYPSKKALILVPTRELAVQIENETNLLGKYLDFKTASFFGGVGYAQQEKALKEGVNIMIATPGRLLDFYKSGKIKLNDASILIIDEADRMFDMGFIPDIRYIIKKMPGPKKRRTMLFSATLSNRVKSLAWEYMDNPVEIEISPESVTVDKITQYLFHVGTEEKMKLLLGLIKKHNPKNAIIFTNMKRTAEIISKRLLANGFSNEYIMGDLPQKKRLHVIDGVKNGKIKFLVATDIAARGLHVDDLDMVINYDIPEDCENYVHRIGRTARAGKTGVAISLACEQYVHGLESIEDYLGMKIPVERYDDNMLSEDFSAEMVFERDRIRKDKKASAKFLTGKRVKTDFVRDKRDSKREHSIKNENTAKSNQFRKDNSKFPSKQHQTQNIKHKSLLEEKNINRKDLNFKKDKKNLIKRDSSVEERMAYYNEKYGDNFKISDNSLGERKKEKKSFLQKVRSLFKK